MEITILHPLVSMKDFKFTNVVESYSGYEFTKKNHKRTKVWPHLARQKQKICSNLGWYSKEERACAKFNSAREFLVYGCLRSVYINTEITKITLKYRNNPNNPDHINTAITEITTITEISS